MNIKEALESSKKNCAPCHRKSPGRNAGWINWYSDSIIYKLSYDDLTATDWQHYGAEGGK